MGKKKKALKYLVHDFLQVQTSPMTSDEICDAIIKLNLVDVTTTLSQFRRTVNTILHRASINSTQTKQDKKKLFEIVSEYLFPDKFRIANYESFEYINLTISVKVKKDSYGEFNEIVPNVEVSLGENVEIFETMILDLEMK